ncbi:DUF58 domain-containing protein [Roseovarius sp. SCSIO 43702]|uniref:DUF58 domain-containing protein n=1 Tax=Roseovarius sp. SCSIO 43702 TaxID=2823043 RepID=UPI001C73AA62|nr:DUF58 domain-containing protein [Roseovarius sp. SCSIO 43702]QYX55719.1 DUF58 domain-containing protein [Roseovarius sp. SCSIO 43702]
MRPSRRLIACVLALAAMTVILMVVMREASGALMLIWGGLLLAALVDLALSVSSRSLTLEASLPEHGFNGMTAPLTGAVSRSGGALPSPVEMRLTLDAGLSADETITLAPGAGDTTVPFEIPLGMSRRGAQTLRTIALRYMSRFGLFEILPRWNVDLTITVLPDIQPVLSGDIQTQLLPLMDGLKVTTLRGEGSEFHQLRDFTPGMDPRSIDWKRSARMNTLVARETRAERNHQIMICIDHGHLMAQRVGTLSKLDHAINAALAMTWAGVLGGDNVGFYTFGARPGQMIAPRGGRTAFARIRATCAELEESLSETNHTLAMTHLNGALSRRSLVIVFSDFVDTTTAELLIENMAVMTRQHLVLYVAMRDRAIEDLARPDTLSMDAISRAISATHIRQERAQVLDRLRRLGVLCLDTDPETLTPDLVSRYMDIKLQGLI